jgi:glucose/arabinose dehydrogenase
VGLLVAVGATAHAQEEVTISFDNSGAEQGITPPGTTEFTFSGASWSGGVVGTEGILALYASGSFSYEMETTAQVVFDPPVGMVEFFYVHGFEYPAGTATAFDSDGNAVASADSNPATSFGDPENFVTLEGESPIQRVEFTSGIVDDFTFVAAEAPPPPPPPAGEIELGEVEIELEEVAGGLTAPVFATHAGDGSGRLFVVDQAGLIRVIDADGQLLETPFLDLSSSIVTLDPGFDERGLLGLAFHPDFEQNGRFFVRYSATRQGETGEPCTDTDRGCHRAVLAEFTVSGDDPEVADPMSETVLLTVDEPQFNHNAGQVLFGPDGFLYVAFGDGGGAHDGLADDPPSHGPIGNGQNTQTLLGSLLRIDVDDGAEPYAIPPDNPFLDQDGRDEIYAWGFRNPYRFSFDRATGELFLADVGQNLFEEIDVVEAGGNYGWVIREGAHCFDPENPETPPESCETEGLIDPIAEYGHSDGLAVVGGFVYRGTQFEELTGKYVFGDFSRPEGDGGRLFYLDAEGDRSQILEFVLGEANEPLEEFVLGFGEDEGGEVYVLTSGNGSPTGDLGRVYRIIAPVSEGENLQVIADCNQDGILDVSDPVCLLQLLFLGRGMLPCEGGGVNDPANVTLFDWQPDSTIDLSDATASLTFLFLGGAPHPLGGDATTCVAVPGCPSGPACP